MAGSKLHTRRPGDQGRRREGRHGFRRAGAATSAVAGPARRDTVVELVARDLDGAEPRAVTLDGTALPHAASRREFDESVAASWFVTDDGLLLLRCGSIPVAARKTFGIGLP